MKAWKHFCTITYHKFLVAKGCFKVGLYKQGILHDLSKYSFTEFRVGARHFQGTRSPNNAEREENGKGNKQADDSIKDRGQQDIRECLLYFKERGDQEQGE